MTMNKENIKFLKAEVVDACNALCKKMNGGYKFGGWISYKNDLNNFWESGIEIIDYKGEVYMSIFSECRYEAQKKVLITSVAQLEQGGNIEYRVYKIQDGLLTLRDWERWGLNRYLIMTINDLKKKAHRI